jgi:hypothetical protein
MRGHSFWPLSCFLLHNFVRTRYLDEMSCFLGRYEICVRDVTMLFCPLCDVLIRLHAFWIPNILFDGVMVRTVERWMLKDAGDRVNTYSGE